MCAGTVVAPPGPTSVAMVSVTSRSRSVALKASFDLSALISTFARIGMVLRRSTTRWTWPSDFNSSARSTVTFIVLSRPGGQKGDPLEPFPQEPGAGFYPVFPGRAKQNRTLRRGFGKGRVLRPLFLQ